MATLSSAQNIPETALNIESLILVFSEEPDTRFLFKILLSMLHYPVVEAQNIEECASIVNSTRPALILMDVKFPFDNDITSLSALRKNSSFGTIPIILVSNYSQKDFQELRDALNVQDHLVKPVDIGQLEGCLKKNIGQSERSEIRQDGSF